MLLKIIIFTLLKLSRSSFLDEESAMLAAGEQKWEEVEAKVEERREEVVRMLMTEKAELEEELRRSSAEIAMLKGNLEEEMLTRCKMEVMKQLEKMVVTPVPFANACVYQRLWDKANSTVTYDRITAGFVSNDYGLTVDIDGGDFIILTSGFYMITFSGHANVQPGPMNEVEMFIYRNNEKVQESRWVTMGDYSGSGSYVIEQGSRTLVSWSSSF